MTVTEMPYYKISLSYYRLEYCALSNFLNLPPQQHLYMFEAKNKEFLRILLSIDGSESSVKAAGYAIAMSRKKGENDNAELIALHVIHSEIKHLSSTSYA